MCGRWSLLPFASRTVSRPSAGLGAGVARDTEDVTSLFSGMGSAPRAAVGLVVCSKGKCDFLVSCLNALSAGRVPHPVSAGGRLGSAAPSGSSSGLGHGACRFSVHAVLVLPSLPFRPL